MNKRLLPLGLAAGLLVGGCSTISSTFDSLNPFASSARKMSPLPELTAGGEVARNLWSASVGKAGGYAFAPAVVGDAVFVADQKGMIYRLEGGKVVWKIDAGQPLSAGVGADASLLVVGTAKGGVLAFDALTGKALWQAQASSEVLAAPAVSREGVAVRSGDNRIFLFDALDGSRKWIYQRPMPALSIRSTGSPIFADRYLFAGFPGGKLVGIALQNGALVWEGTVAQPKGTTELDRVADIVSPPVVDGTQICAVAFQGRIACFDMAQGGALIWSRDISSARGLVLDGRYLFVTDDDGVVYGLDRLSGSSLWKQDKLRNRGVSAPAVRGNLVAVADGEGYLHFLSREEGAFVARQKTDGTPVTAAPQLLGSAFLTQTTGGDIRAIEIQ
jgi:outer membrane protein assembly factor BamB